MGISKGALLNAATTIATARLIADNRPVKITSEQMGRLVAEAMLDVAKAIELLDADTRLEISTVWHLADD